MRISLDCFIRRCGFVFLFIAVGLLIVNDGSAFQPLFTLDEEAINDLPIDFVPINGTWVVVDVDGDGLEDVLYHGASFPDNEPVPVFAFHNLGEDRFELIEADELLAGQLPHMRLVRRFIRSDLNGDGRLDVIGSNAGIDFEPFTGEANFMLLSQADGSLDLSTTGFPVFEDLSHGVAIGDIDNDRDLDIFFVNHCCGEVGPYFLINSGAGKFSVDQTRIPRRFLEINGGRPGRLGDVREAMLDAVIFDANGDGFNDLVFGAATPDDPQVSPVPGWVLLNDGVGYFSSFNPIPLPGGLVGARTETVEMLQLDLNQDGLEDLLLSQINEQGGGAFLQALISLGNGQFTDESNARIHAEFPLVLSGNELWIQKLEPIDFDLDGDLDILVQITDTGIPESTILLNDGAGVFTELNLNAFPIPPVERLEHWGFITNDLPLIPVAGEGGVLNFISLRFVCTGGNEVVGCTQSLMKTVLYKKN